MASFFKRYKERMQLKHGWEVELKCPKCNYNGKPEYKGWTSSQAISVGKQAMIYANLACPKCNNELKEEANKKLIELFSNISISSLNKKYLTLFLVSILAILPLALFLLGGFKLFPFMILFILPAIFIFNYKIASIRFRCVCGKPNYIFMGMLGRSYCHRCSSCGKLLRTKD